MYLHICRDGDENTIEQEVDMKYLVLLLTVVLCLPGPSALAQYRVPHGVFGSGGGTSSGSHIVYGTAGQGPVGLSTGSHTVKSGFWYVAGVSSTVDVAITAFSAEYAGDIVRLTWEISASGAFDGFDVYRGEGDGEFERLNQAPLPADDARGFEDETAIPGREYTYRLEALDGPDVFSAELKIELPPRPLTLYQNFPNPFNPATSIAFFLPRDETVSIVIFDVGGRMVRTLLQEKRSAGKHTVVWNGGNEAGSPAASGVYYCRLTAGKQKITRKLVLMR